MTTNVTSAFFDETQPEIGFIQITLCYLMTRYALRPCTGLLFTIIHHLQILLAHPDLADLPERKKTYYGLLQDWNRIAEHAQTAYCKEATYQQGDVIH